MPSLKSLKKNLYVKIHLEYNRNTDESRRIVFKFLKYIIITFTFIIIIISISIIIYIFIVIIVSYAIKT